jgi:hypothetical protein
MDKNTENAIVDALGELSLSLEDMKTGFNVFGEKVLEKLDSIDSNLK